jgi:uncharacterized membrane protein
MADALAVFMRWLHISAVALLIGGLLYGRLALKATGETLAPDAVEKLGDSAAALFRPRVVVAILALLISGIYNILTTPGHTTRYHIWLAIKLLLVLHVFASAFLATRPGNPRRARMMASAGLSGLIVILISAFLRRIF